MVLPHRPIAGKDSLTEERTELPVSDFANFEVIEVGGQEGLYIARLDRVYDVLSEEAGVCICPGTFQLVPSKDETVKDISFETKDIDEPVYTPRQLVD